jgi:hypothetical protein
MSTLHPPEWVDRFRSADGRRGWTLKTTLNDLYREYNIRDMASEFSFELLSLCFIEKGLSSLAGIRSIVPGGDQATAVHLAQPRRD